MTEEKKNLPHRARKVGIRGAKSIEKSSMSAPVKLKLLITVVNREKVEFYTDLLQSFDVNMQMSFSARGTASSDILQLMGLEESGKSVIFMLAIIVGYIAGIASKIVGDQINYVLFMYALNLLMVSVDLAVYFVNRKRENEKLNAVQMEAA